MLDRLKKAAEFESDFAPLERALRYERRLGGTVMTPEQTIVSLHLTSEQLKRLGFFGLTIFEMLVRHELFPPKKISWEKWLGHYRRRLAAIARRRRAFRKAHLRSGSAWSIERTAAFLGVDSTTIFWRYFQHRLVAIEVAHERLAFPVWQFDLARRRIRPGVQTVLSEMPKSKRIDDWVVCAFFLMRHAALGNRAPVEVLDDARSFDALARLAFAQN